MPSAAMIHVDYIHLSRRALGLVFIWYWISIMRHPFLYASSFQRLGIEPALGPFVIAMTVASLLLFLGRWVTFAATLLLFWQYFVFFTDPAACDLYWTFSGWLLVAFIFLDHGFDRRPLVELGWLIGGLVLTVHGIAKLQLAGSAWLSGDVVRTFISVFAPNLFQWLQDWGLDVFVGLAGGWFVIAFHLAALPHALIHSSRRLFIFSAVIFHGFILISYLYFISIGFIPFWLFLCDGTFKSRIRIPTFIPKRLIS